MTTRPEPQSADLGTFARLALACVHREYPSQVSLSLRSDEDARPPRELTPCFYGCYDWHSAVHGHWVLARLARLHPAAPWAAPAREALARTLTAERVSGELRFLADRPTFERPYGLAWLLRLHAELGAFEDAQGRSLAATLTPLAQLCALRFAEWLPKLAQPIRSGVHSQTAFSLGLVLEWASAVGERSIEALVRERALTWHGEDRDLGLHLEPSGEDFLSPALGAADLMARLLAPEPMGAWLARALPEIPRDGADGWLAPVAVTDPTDGRLAHLDGLNLSRAWMLEAIAAGLPRDDARRASLRGAAARHRDRGLGAVTGAHYAGGHWLGSFAVYLLARRGVAGER